MGKPLHCLGEESDGQVKSVALSPDGETLAVGYHEGFIRFYDVPTGTSLPRIFMLCLMTNF
jgi:WD40 repeat protein